MTTAWPNVILSSVQYSQAQARRNHPCQPRRRSLSVMKKILGIVVLSLFAISASAADLMASSAAPTVTQNIVVEGAACPGVGATGFSSTGLLLSCQSGVWKGSTGEQSCFYMTIAGSSLTFRGVGLLEGAQFSGTMLRADRPAPSYYFGYHHDCRSDTACVASRGAYVASIGGSGSFHSILHVANLPVQAASACL